VGGRDGMEEESGEGRRSEEGGGQEVWVEAKRGAGTGTGIVEVGGGVIGSVALDAITAIDSIITAVALSNSSFKPTLLLLTKSSHIPSKSHFKFIFPFKSSTSPPTPSY
jgi:hypothetical protein